MCVCGSQGWERGSCEYGHLGQWTHLCRGEGYAKALPTLPGSNLSTQAPHCPCLQVRPGRLSVSPNTDQPFSSPRDLYTCQPGSYFILVSRTRAEPVGGQEVPGNCGDKEGEGGGLLVTAQLDPLNQKSLKEVVPGFS